MVTPQQPEPVKETVPAPEYCIMQFELWKCRYLYRLQQNDRATDGLRHLIEEADAQMTFWMEEYANLTDKEIVIR